MLILQKNSHKKKLIIGLNETLNTIIAMKKEISSRCGKNKNSCEFYNENNHTSKCSMYLDRRLCSKSNKQRRKSANYSRRVNNKINYWLWIGLIIFLSACAPRPYSFFVSDIYTSKNDDKKVVYELREKETLYELIVKDSIGKYKINDTIFIK